MNEPEDIPEDAPYEFPDDLAEGADRGHAEPRPVDRWRRSTASGALTAALALGFQQVFEPEKTDTIGIEQEAPARPVDPDALELHFDPMNSQGSSVIIHRRPQPDPEPQPEDP
ncbi:MAG: hypothetical protein M3159_04060 [Actinomycetota bacterium]|nr:hypothetical protein [Actinomycetota bacterium]